MNSLLGIKETCIFMVQIKYCLVLLDHLNFSYFAIYPALGGVASIHISFLILDTHGQFEFATIGSLVFFVLLKGLTFKKFFVIVRN